MQPPRELLWCVIGWFNTCVLHFVINQLCAHMHLKVWMHTHCYQVTQQHPVVQSTTAKATAPETVTSRSTKRSKISNDSSPAASTVPADVSDDTEANTVEEDDDAVPDEV
jgi:hypothetical protein